MGYEQRVECPNKRRRSEAVSVNDAPGIGRDGNYRPEGGLTSMKAKLTWMPLVLLSTVLLAGWLAKIEAGDFSRNDEADASDYVNAFVQGLKSQTNASAATAGASLKEGSVSPSPAKRRRALRYPLPAGEREGRGGHSNPT